MKRSPQDKKLEQMLRSTKLVAHGFMGDDKRTPEEIILQDQMTLEKLGHTQQQIAERMHTISEQARPALGMQVVVEDKYEVHIDEFKGNQTCPWPHTGSFRKEITYCKRTDTGQSLQWTDLNIHLIEEHGFFEGKGSTYRLEPEQLISFLFD